MRKQTILLADDHPLVMEMAASILEPTYEVVGRVRDGQALFELASKLNPDIIVTDISMPILDGLHAVKKLGESGCTSKILFLTVHTDLDIVRACLAAKALGYVIKRRMATDLLRAIREALAGNTFVSSSLTY